MSLEKLKSLGSYMISLDKINKGSMIASKGFEVPFFVFVFLIPDKRIFFWKVSDEKGNFLMPIKVQSQKHPLIVRAVKGSKTWLTCLWTKCRRPSTRPKIIFRTCKGYFRG